MFNIPTSRETDYLQQHKCLAPAQYIINLNAPSDTVPNKPESILPPLDDKEQLELDRQFINAAGLGNIDLVKSLHRRGANINSSDGLKYTPTAAIWATGGYKIVCDTLQIFSTTPLPSKHIELKKYREVIRYLCANGLDWKSQQPATQLLIRQALEEDKD